MIIPVKTATGTYDIVLECGGLKKAGEYLSLDRRVLVVTDSGVPREYAQTVASFCKDAKIVTIPAGENSKQVETLNLLLETMVKEGFTRTDCVVAVGGGVVGDVSGFAASVYMRGVDFYNVPTTLLSQVDSSVGGKTAINFMGYKNIVGAFYPPKRVIIDPDTLKTLPARQLASGLAESVKMALTSDKELFAIFENENTSKEDTLYKIIEGSIKIKKQIVEEDEKEKGKRRVLNFGHTLAHAIESVTDMQTYYHGECVAIGMVPMCSDKVRDRLVLVLKRLNLPTAFDGKEDELIAACRHDKKMSGSDISVVYVDEIGDFEIKTIPFSEWERIVRSVI